MRDFMFFFQNFSSGEKAPVAFMYEVVANLDIQIYRHNEVVVERNSNCDHLLLIRSGTCALYQVYKSFTGDE